MRSLEIALSEVHMSKKQKKGFYEKYIKVPQDMFLAALALVLLSPVLFVIALLVRVKLGAPVIYKQERAGKDGKAFCMYKFRTMSNARDAEGNLLPDEQRLDHFGRVLRSTSLDEIPSLWNVVCHKIALVGPRCLYIRYNDRYNARQGRRLEVLPGITGLAQINGRNAISWETKFEYDVQYVDHITFIGDWKILFKTIGKVIKREGISSATSVTMEEFMGTKTEIMTPKTEILVHE